MNVKTKTEYQYMPFIVKELEDRAGGISIALADLRKDVGSVPPGAFIGEDDKGMGHILKSAELVENANATAKTFKVKKSHQLIVGDIITSKDVEGVKAYKVTEVKASEEEFDTVTVGTALGIALEAGQNLIAVKAEDANGGESVLPYTLIGVSKKEIDTSGSHAMAGVLTKGTVNVANMAFGAPKAFRDAWIHITYEDPIKE